MIRIRDMHCEDSETISAAFARQGWCKPVGQFEQYAREQQDARRDVLIATWHGQFAGYVTVVWDSVYPPFREEGIPEICDFNVLIEFQRRGIGSALMDEAERRIAVRSARAGLGVCLHVDYGPAQILYIRRGYIPDGRGVSWNGRLMPAGASVILDDGLVLHLVKDLQGTRSQVCKA